MVGMESPDFLPDFVAAASGLREDVAVVKTPSGKAVMLPRSFTRLDPDTQELAAEVQAAALALQQAHADLEQLVAQLRASGGSWSLVGWCVGTTGEAARQRWGHL